MDLTRAIAAVLLAYFLGSFPAGYLIGKLWHVNVLDRGSGRTGGTNVFRSAGLAAGLFTGAVDIGKGFLAVWLAGQISSNALVQVLAGAAVILGHIHSIFLGFRGGAGVATSLGALAAIYLPAAIGLLIVLVLVMVLTRYASLGSLTVSVLMPIVLLILGLTNIVSLVYVMYGLLAFVIIVYAHQGNIRRLLQGTERRLGPPRH